jgi:hypothetical protein
LKSQYKVVSEINLHPLKILNCNALSFDKFYKHKYEQKRKVGHYTYILANYGSLEIAREVGCSERKYQKCQKYV